MSGMSLTLTVGDSPSPMELMPTGGVFIQISFHFKNKTFYNVCITIIIKLYQNNCQFQVDCKLVTNVRHEFMFYLDFSSLIT